MLDQRKREPLAAPGHRAAVAIHIGRHLRRWPSTAAAGGAASAAAATRFTDTDTDTDTVVTVVRFRCA